MMKNGASNTIAVSAKTISITRFEVSPTGRGIIVGMNRTSRSAAFAFAKPSMSGNPKYVAVANKTASIAIVPIASQFCERTAFVSSRTAELSRNVTTRLR
jgi:hypothetical protein